MRRSTGQYVVLKKLAMGQILYELKIIGNISCGVNPVRLDT